MLGGEKFFQRGKTLGGGRQNAPLHPPKKPATYELLRTK